MAETPKPSNTVPTRPTSIDALPPATAALWPGTGLCCEAQGDGVPCRGTDGECETCGRALPVPPPDHSHV